MTFKNMALSGKALRKRTLYKTTWRPSLQPQDSQTLVGRQRCQNPLTPMLTHTALSHSMNANDKYCGS